MMQHKYEGTVLVQRLTGEEVDLPDGVDKDLKIVWVRTFDYQVKGTFEWYVAGGPDRVEKELEELSSRVIDQVLGCVGKGVLVRLDWERVWTNDLPGAFSFAHIPKP